jgi:hypothetical protein
MALPARYQRYDRLIDQLVEELLLAEAFEIPETKTAGEAHDQAGGNSSNRQRDAFSTTADRTAT